MTYVISRPTKAINSHIQSEYPDLVNNFELFQENFSDEYILDLPDWSDNTNYSNLESLDELVERLDGNFDPTYTYTVRVPIEYIYSSITQQGGYDRTYDVYTKKSYIDTCRKNLNEEYNGKVKGYRQDDAGTLQGMIRVSVIVDFKTGETKKLLTVVKPLGNNRVLMKLFANKGVPTEVKVDVRFHAVDVNTLDAYIREESEVHTTDAGNRNGQNEQQKFHSGFRAGRQDCVECYNFLYNHGLNYNNIMQIQGIADADDRLNLSNIMGLNSGIGNGMFKRYGEGNVIAAVDSARKIAKEITSEKTIPITPIWCLALMYRVMTDIPFGKTDNSPLLTKGQLNEFFFKFWEMKNREDDFGGDKTTFGLDELGQTGGVKNYAYIVARMFWENDSLIRWYKSQRDRKYGFSSDCAPMAYLLSQTDEFLKKEVTRLVA